MSFLNNVLRDLVEKRLWPIALGLVAVLVAVPLTLGSGGSSSSKPAPAAPAAGTTASAVHTGEAVVAVKDAPPALRRRPGPLRDPFVQPKALDKATDAQAPSAGTQASGTGSSSGASTSAGGSTTPFGATTPSGSTVTTPGKPKADTPVFQVSLRFGRATGKLKQLDDVTRLTPLPSIERPFFVYLGVLDDHKTAVFLVDGTATPTGDGTCKPSKAECATIHMKAGDTEFFDLVDAGGSPVQYELDLVKVSRKGTTTSKAAVAYRRHSLAGQELVRTLSESEGSPALRRYHFRPDDGLLVQARRRPGARIASEPAPYRYGTGEVAVFHTLRKRDR
jgi:hypothetical protein